MALPGSIPACHPRQQRYWTGARLAEEMDASLDHAAWPQHHRVQVPARPASPHPALAALPQVHLLGAQDRVIPPMMVQDFVAGYPPGNQARVQVLPGYDHHCCWAENWAQLWRQNALP